MDTTRAEQQAMNSVAPAFELEDDGLEIGLDSRTTHLCNLVFDIDLLRETILDFVINDYNDPQRLSKQNALWCRKVQKSWRESVFKCLVKSGKWLFELGEGRSIESFLKKYDEDFSSPLPYKLTTWFFTEAVEQDLEKCLHFCNDGLVELELERCYLQYPDDLPEGLLRQKLTLPNLQKLKYSVEPLSILPDTEQENNGIDIHYVPQLILAGAFNLKCFEFSFAECIHSTELPAAAASFGNILLPGTIKNLKLDCLQTTYHLEPFLKINKLSNLTDLTVVMPHDDGDYDWFSQVLNRVSNTLKNLTINGGQRMRNLTVFTIDPPVMKCLKHIIIRIVNFEWADGITDLHLKLPALEKLVLQEVRSSILKKWVDNSKFDLLTDLSIEFFKFGLPEKSFLTIDNAQLMSQAFLNVTKLEVSTPCGDTTAKALQCLFQNMTQLQVLIMELVAIEGHVVPPRYLDALLLGISCEVIDTFKSVCAPGKLWETVQLNADEQLSVVNLSQLKELTLYSSDELFVSEKVEAFVVSKMPNLPKIKLPRPEEVSEEGGPDVPYPN